MNLKSSADNLLNLNYREEATRFEALSFPIIDIHSHISGARAVELYRDAARAYGIGRTFSMTHLEGLDSVRRVLGDSVEFIAIPNWSGSEPILEHLERYHDRLRRFWQQGARIAKFWSAPRIFDHLAGVPAHQSPLRLNSPERLATLDTALDLGFQIMLHVADPDTWFATKYADGNRYGTKTWHLEVFEEVVARVAPRRVLAAHMGGNPENLTQLSSLLERYPNLYLDCSATKWQVRELSKHEPTILSAFFERWSGRVLYGSDIVTAEEHLVTGDKRHEMLAKANSEESAFDLYASRYWAYRTLFETSYDGPSPIVDPDLAMIDPQRYDSRSSPRLRAGKLSLAALKALYHDAAVQFLEKRDS